HKIIVDDSATYRVQTELVNLTSRLEILKPEELLKGRYFCLMSCSSDNIYNISCLVSKFEYRNRSFLCSEQNLTGLADSNNMQPPTSPGRVTFHSRASDSDDAHHTVEESRQTGASDRSSPTFPSRGAVLAASVVSAVVFFVVVVMLLRWYVKRRITAKQLRERGRVGRSSSRTRTHSSSSAQHRNDEQRETGQHHDPPRSAHESRQRRTTLARSAAISLRLQRPSPTRRHRSSRSRSASPRHSRRTVPNLHPSLNLGAQIAQAQARHEMPMLQGLPRSSEFSEVVYRRLPDGSHVLCIPSLPLPSYEDAVAESRQGEAHRGGDAGGGGQSSHERHQQPSRLSHQQQQLIQQEYMQLSPEAFGQLSRRQQRQFHLLSEPPTAQSPPPPYRSSTRLCAEGEDQSDAAAGHGSGRLRPNPSCTSVFSSPPSYHSALGDAGGSCSGVSSDDDLTDTNSRQRGVTPSELAPLTRSVDSEDRTRWRFAAMMRSANDGYSEAETESLLTGSGSTQEPETEQQRRLQARWPMGRPPPLYDENRT
ncbi:hypothetical protein BaRGS_00036480, partial [Batillaria attramentaria]